MQKTSLLLDILIKSLITILLLILLCFTLAKIGERLDEQDRAQRDYIQNYKTEIKREQVKETN